MAGNLIIGQLNSGQVAYRNVLINGGVTINQRNVSFSSASVGDYWADRWKKTGATTMTQIVEEGSFRPSTVYTLSGTGVTTQQVTSPPSGNWTIPNIPSSATNVQLEEGTEATPFEYRPFSLELLMCERYFQKTYANIRYYAGGTSRYSEVPINWVPMRVAPTVSPEGTAATNMQAGYPKYPGVDITGCRMEAISSGTGDTYALNIILRLDAEI